MKRQKPDNANGLSANRANIARAMRVRIPKVPANLPPPETKTENMTNLAPHITSSDTLTNLVPQNKPRNH